jgi:hypothetical protein
MNETTFTFSNEQIEFLNSYCPKDDMFTSNEECELVIEKLGLSNLSLRSLRECRNAVVQFYSNKRHTNRLDDYMTPMMSVTAVIDHYSMGYTA